MRALRFLFLSAITLAVLAQVELFQEGTEVLSNRWESATVSEDAEGGMLGRVFKSLINPLKMLPSIPLLGAGLGVGTNVGAALLTGKSQFLLSEGEWGRILLEMGPFLGIWYVGFRVTLTIWIARQCVRHASAGHTLPLLLFGGCASNLLTGQLSQPTALGFTVLGAGLCLAALHAQPLPEEPLPKHRSKVPPQQSVEKL